MKNISTTEAADESLTDTLWDRSREYTSIRLSQRIFGSYNKLVLLRKRTIKIYILYAINVIFTNHKI